MVQELYKSKSNKGCQTVLIFRQRKKRKKITKPPDYLNLVHLYFFSFLVTFCFNFTLDEAAKIVSFTQNSKINSSTAKKEA